MFARNGCSRGSWPGPLGAGPLGGASRPGQWFIFLSGKSFPTISACRHIGWGLKFLFGQKSPSKSGLSSNPMVLESLPVKNFPSIPACRQIRWCLKCLTEHKHSIQIQASARPDGEQALERQIGLHPCQAVHKIRWGARHKRRIMPHPYLAVS